MKARLGGRTIEIATGRGGAARGGMGSERATDSRPVPNPVPSPFSPGPQVFFVLWKLPGLNELLAACRSVNPRSGWQRYATLKRQVQQDLCRVIRHAKIKPMACAYLVFTWYEVDRRRDLDNIAAGGRKFILDALVRAKILPTDGWAGVLGWRDDFRVDRALQGVEVQLYATNEGVRW